jgi:Transcriptional regulators of sugar metabolism
MQLTNRQQKIISMTKENSPLTSEQIAEKLDLSVPTIRGDLRLLTATEILKSRPKVGYEYQGLPKPNLNYKDLYETTISQILKTPVLVKPSTTLQECVNSLFLKDAGSLYVVDPEKNCSD